VMCCVSSVRFAINFNGVLLDPFQPMRGLRQGDLLSPYLFLFVADSLSLLLRKEELEGAISPIKISRSALRGFFPRCSPPGGYSARV
jgi:hypothetical protein